MSVFHSDAYYGRDDGPASMAWQDADTVLDRFCRYDLGADTFAFMEPLPLCERLQGGAL